MGTEIGWRRADFAEQARWQDGAPAYGASTRGQNGSVAPADLTRWGIAAEGRCHQMIDYMDRQAPEAPNTKPKEWVKCTTARTQAKYRASSPEAEQWAPSCGR